MPMPFPRVLLIASLVFPSLCSCRSTTERTTRVGSTDAGVILPTQQRIHLPGRSAGFHGRPVDLAVAPDHKTLYVKSNDAVIVIDAGSWKIRQQWKYPPKNGASPHGIVLSQDGSRLYVTTGQSNLLEVAVQTDGKLALAGTIRLPAPKGDKRETFPCGLALSADGKTAYVCLNARDALAVVALDDGTVQAEIPVGIAPYAVCISPDGKTAYVTNWGGRRARAGDLTAKSYGTDVVIDQRGTAATGTLSVVDLIAMKETQQIETGLHPSDLLLAKGGQTLYVACASSDAVSVIDTMTRKVTRELNVRPDPALAFGSMPNALALSDDGKALFVAVGGNNAVAVIDLGGPGPAPSPAPSVAGFIPAGWYPGALAASGNRLMIANVKGVGSRDPSAAGKWNTHSSWASVLSVDVPDPSLLSQYTQQVKRDALVPQALKAWERAQTGIKATPVPRRFGEPSVFEHVVYIIKEGKLPAVRPELFKDASEKALSESAKGIEAEFDALLSAQKFNEAFQLLNGLTGKIDGFFTGVMVMDKDPEIKENRLALLAFIRAMFLKFGDFSKINTK